MARAPELVDGEGGHFACPDDWDVRGLMAALAGSFALRERPAESGEFGVWDTFDWRIWSSGCVLLSRADTWELLSLEDGEPRVVVPRSSDAPERCPGDFWDERLRDALVPLLGVRSVMRRCSVGWRSALVEALNPLQKTVCRIGFAEWKCAGASGGGRTVYRAVVRPLRGYDADAGAVIEHLNATGARPATAAPLVELLHHAGFEPDRPPMRLEVELAPDMSAREAVSLLSGELLRLARTCESGIRDDVDSEFLHDYRVCLRKARSVVSLVKGVYGAAPTRRVKSLLARIARKTNRLRDCDVALLSRRRYESLLPSELRAGLSTWFQEVSTARAHEQVAVARYLGSRSYLRTIEELERFFAEADRQPKGAHSARSIGPFVAETIYRRYRKIVKAARKTDGKTPDNEVHALRIECKKLRYLLEFSRGLESAGATETMVTSLRKLQNRLGAFNDYTVQRQTLLEDFHRREFEDGAEMALAIGGLATALYDRQLGERKRILADLRAFCSKEMRGLFRNTFGRSSSRRAPKRK